MVEIELKYYSKFFIEERGYMYTVDLIRNKFPTEKDEIYKFFYNHIFIIEATPYKVFSIEFFGDKCEYTCINISFKKINNCK